MTCLVSTKEVACYLAFTKTMLDTDLLKDAIAAVKKDGHTYQMPARQSVFSLLNIFGIALNT